MHRRLPAPQSAAEDGDESVAETADSSVVIRMTPREKGEELLTVEVVVTEEEPEEAMEDEKGEE